MWLCNDRTTSLRGRFRSLILWSKISFASDVIGRIMDGVKNGCQS